MVAYTDDGYIRLANLEALTWTLTALTVALSAGRYTIRFVTKRTFLWDDLTHLLALLMMVAMVGVFQTAFRHFYYFTAIQRGIAPPPTPQVFKEKSEDYRNKATATAILLFTSTWLVKLTFMLLYKTIFDVDRHFVRAWWSVLVFVFLTYWVAFAGVLAYWVALAGIWKYCVDLASCTRDENDAYGHTLLKYTCAVSVSSDAAIMALPLWKLRTLKMQTVQKLGLAGMFLIGTIIIILDVLRTIQSLGQRPLSEVAVYEVVENTMAVIISCVPTYCSLLNIYKRKRRDNKIWDRLYSKPQRPDGSENDPYRLGPVSEASRSSILGETVARHSGIIGVALPSQAHV